MFHPLVSPLLLLLLQITTISSYTFPSSVDNLLYIKNSSTLFLISSSHLYQLHWSTTNQSLLLLHRRVQLHSSIDNAEDGVSVFIYHELKQLLIICAKSSLGRCILYDAKDITRTYLLDPNLETNYLGCLIGCYTFISSTNIIRSALNNNRLERNGNILNSQIELGKDRLSYQIKYQLESSDKSLITSLTFLPERLVEKPNYDFLYGFDHQQYTYYVLKSSRLARLCQSSIAMRVTYDEIPLIHCQNDNFSIITGAFVPSENQEHLFVVFSNHVCMYSMSEISSAFSSSKNQCNHGFGYRLEHIVDSTETRPICEKTLEENSTDTNQCLWQSYRINTYTDGLIGAQGDSIYQTENQQVKIEFLFVEEDILILSTNERKIFKFIRVNQTKLYLLHEAIYQNEPFNQQYVIDYEHQSLIFAVHSELHRYAYNSCSLYDTCQSCLASRRYDPKACIWFDGKCSLSSNSNIMDRGCPPAIDQIQPLNVSVNNERVRLEIKGLFQGVEKHLVTVVVKFPLANQSEVFCSIENLANESLTCQLIVPKQPVEGNISIEIKTEKRLSKGDTDLEGTIQFEEKFKVYPPKASLRPDYGPVAGGTKIRIENLAYDSSMDFSSNMKIFLGKKQCQITEITPEHIECVNQACTTVNEPLELTILVKDQLWLIEKTFFHCRNNPIIYDWSPRRSIASGGIPLIIRGGFLNNIQNPLMKFSSNTSDYEYSSICEEITNTQMTCQSPALDKNQQFNLPLDFQIHFILDNLQIIPDENLFTVVNDPIYHSFENYIQEMNPSNIIHVEGQDLRSTHSIDLINVRIDHANNACTPLNLTDTSFDCLISKTTFNKLTSSAADVEIQIGRNLTFNLGRVLLYNSTNNSSRNLTKQISSWTLIFFLILSSLTLLTLICCLSIYIRRRYFNSSSKPNHPPAFHQDVWCELGKKRQINLKSLTIGEKIGQGCFGDVYRGEYKSPTNELLEVAIKVLRDQNLASMHEFLFEANRMKDFAHGNILSLIGVAWDPHRKAMVLLPYMKNGDLRSYILNEKNRPTVRQLINWGIEVADGMEYLSSLKFVHRDLATRNCMLDENLVCRISDFGLSRDVMDKDYYLVPRTTVTKEKDGQIIQIPPRRLPIRWLSPESIESSKYTIQSDVWSYGVLLWELLSRGKTPYPGIDNADIYSYVKNGYRLPQPTYCPPLIYNSAMLICWDVDPSQRPIFSQLAQDIRHILHQLELAQEQQRLSSTTTTNDDETLVVERNMKHLSTSSSSDDFSGQYITTPHRQSENLQLLIDRNGDEEDAYAVAVHSSSEVFSTTRLLPKYTETSISEEA